MIYHKNITHTHSHSTPLTSRHINLLTPSKNTLKKKNTIIVQFATFQSFCPLHYTTQRKPQLSYSKQKNFNQPRKKNQKAIYIKIIFQSHVYHCLICVTIAQKIILIQCHIIIYYIHFNFFGLFSICWSSCWITITTSSIIIIITRWWWIVVIITIRSIS
jgi:hypothetical protein